jgi:gamma-glutamyltranspeptidase/glutathione hydrolase
MGFGGAVATSQPLATQAGLHVLLQGGNAMDAALATAATLSIVEPMGTGLGGDLFALVYWAKDRRIYALNASGRAPYAATAEEYARRGCQEVPLRGILSVTVPGAAAGWCDLQARFGSWGLDRVLQPAIAYAEQGYPVSERIADMWREHQASIQADPGASRTYLFNGRAPRAGQRVTLPETARTLRLLAEGGAEAFYRGPVAEAIVAASERYDGLLSLQDLSDHTSTWVEPIHTDYRGYTVWECPPNGQGVAALEALNILSGYDLASMDPNAADTIHLRLEAIKLALADAGRYVTDPELGAIPVKGLLSLGYAAQRRTLIRMDQAIAQPQAGLPPSGHDTVYLCTADSEGNAVSFIQSQFLSFGSGIAPEGVGFTLQNRGNLFSLDPEHPNCIAPHKRPYHTIIPAMVTQDGRLVSALGVMGGAIQPQGHMMVLSNIIDHGMSVQEALYAPRFYYQKENEVWIEPYWPEAVYADLRQRGHALQMTEGPVMGGAQLIWVDPESGAYLAASEPRKDGCALAF